MKWPPNRKPLEGTIVRLEPIAAEHLDDLRAASRDDETWTWLDRDVPRSDEAFSRWFDARLTASEAGEEWSFVTRSVETGGLIGSSSYLHVRPEHDGLGCMRVEFKTDARNERSRAALEALPTTFEGIFRQHMLVPGVGRRDSAYYSIVDAEWPQVRTSLERRLAREPARA